MIKLRYIGDTVLTTPLLQALAEGLPGASVDVLVHRSTASVLKGHPDVRRVLALDEGRRNDPGAVLGLLREIRRGRYDTAIDLTNNDRSAFLAFASGARRRIGYRSDHLFRNRLFYTRVVDSVLDGRHTVDHHLKAAEALNLPATEIHPRLPVADEDGAWADHLLTAAGVSPRHPFVAIHPGSRRWYKSWPPERFAALAGRIIREAGLPAVLLGGPGDRGAVDRIRQIAGLPGIVDLSGEVPLKALPAVIGRAACLVGNDSAPIHMATAVGTPAVALFGPTRWESWGPRRPHDRVVAAEFPCRPCGHGRKDCPRGGGYCMASLPVERVFRAVAEILPMEQPIRRGVG